MATPFTSRAQSVNSMFVKPALRKSIHKKSSLHDKVRDVVKFNAEEVKTRSDGQKDGVEWVPHERTGIYYPKGQENVMKEVSSKAGAYPEEEVNWFY